MPWVRLDDGFADHPKIEQAGPLAAWLHVAALCYCTRHLTDGVIPHAKVVRLTSVPQPAKRIVELIAAGMWEREGADAYRLHDFLDYQPSRAQVDSDRIAARDRMAKVRNARSSPEQPRSSDEQPANVRTNFGDRSPYPVPTRPDPLQPQGQLIPVESNGHSTPSVVDPFDEFWKIYPLKREKATAKAAWKKAVKRAKPAVIIAGAKRYRNDPRRDPEFTKYPQGWLNADRWLDEPEETRPRMSKAALANKAWAERTS